tara:strand:- start:82 stop:429 length:348 start_codon:yes stop_codon:yes gene_type:complete
MCKNIKNRILAIALGASFGSLISLEVNNIYLINILGCFILGLVHKIKISEKYKLIFGFSFCGSLTSFSGFIYILFLFLEQGWYIKIILTLLYFYCFGLFSVLAGNYLAKKINELF